MIFIKTSTNRWLKISLIVVLLLFITAISYGFFIYHGLLKQKDAGYDKSIKQVLADTPLTEIDEKYKFFGKDNYHIFLGSTKGKQEKMVFFPLDDQQEITILDQSNILSQEDVKQQWKNHCESCKLMDVGPAMDDGAALWELTYKDEQGRLILDYVSLKDGSEYEQYRFNQMFK